MKIAYISCEMCPIAKVGGLADVSLGLAREVQAQGHEVFTILPFFSCIKAQYLTSLTLTSFTYTVYFNNVKEHVRVWQAKLYDLNLYLLEPTTAPTLFDRPHIYGYRDDARRFSFFSLIALEFIAGFKPKTELIHLNEWHTSLVAPLYREHYHKRLKSKIVLTLHNINYQGNAYYTLLEKIGLPKEKYVSTLHHSPKIKNHVNFLELGILYSDFITTVSPKYAEEIMSVRQGSGLHEILIKNKHKLIGILNGIDNQMWDPQSDPALTTHYTYNHIDKKHACKDQLRKLLDIPLKANSPLVICICRLVPQKGLHMIKKAILHTLECGGQFILFGSSPIAKIQHDFDQLKEKLHHDPNVKLIFDSYNEELAHQIYAGADLIICPSLFEPCGLTQLIACRYGTVPIVRQTGGLANTVFDVDEYSSGNGFTYLPPTRKAISETLERAFAIYHDDPKRWKEIIKTGMQMDFSWKQSAKEYLKVYQQLVEHPLNLVNQ